MTAVRSEHWWKWIPVSSLSCWICIHNCKMVSTIIYLNVAYIFVSYVGPVPYIYVSGPAFIWLLKSKSVLTGNLTFYVYIL